MNDKKFEKKYRQLEARLREQLARDPGCHDFDHTSRVIANALKLAAELPEADVRVVRMAALLHDVARPEEAAKSGKQCHARLGARLARSWLEETEGFEEEFIDRVCAAVRTHRYRDAKIPASLEAEIVYDADKLDSMGAIGVGRAFHFAGHACARVHNTAKEAMRGRAYGPQDTAYREYLVKLRGLSGAMLTRPGCAFAESRAAFMKTFFEELAAETGLE